LVLEFGGAYRPSFGDPAKLEVGYDFSQSLYDQLDDFDLRSQNVIASVDREVGGIDFGLNYLYGRTSLGRVDFLSLHSLTPTAGITVSDHWYTSVRYSAISKDFRRTADGPRDGWNNAVALDNFVFFGKDGSYVSSGYKIENENTDGPQFDYLGHFVWARLKFAVPTERLSRLKPIAETGALYFIRHYDNVTPSIGEKRNDKRMEFNATLTVAIAHPAFCSVSYQYVNAISNLPTVDYNDQVVTFRLGFKL
jgi:hypothetical protein